MDRWCVSFWVNNPDTGAWAMHGWSGPARDEHDARVRAALAWPESQPYAGGFTGEVRIIDTWNDSLALGPWARNLGEIIDRIGTED